jgi:hypothetical protein
MKFRHAPWRKLYREEQGAFAQLPWLARAAAALLLKPTDDDGRIHIGALRDGETCAEAMTRVIAFRMGATRSDRRMMPSLFNDLLGEGYLVHEGEYVRIRNFVEGQARETSAIEPRRRHEPAANGPRTSSEPSTTAPRTDREPTANEQRAVHDSATNERRTDHERATETDLTPRNLDTDDANARARAQSSEEKREDPTRTEEREKTPLPRPHVAGATLWLDGDQLAMALAKACSRFQPTAGIDLLNELHRIALTAKPKALTLADFTLIGEATSAGIAFDWCDDDITVSRLVANSGKHLFDALAIARTWERNGRKATVRAKPAKAGGARAAPAPVSRSFADDGGPDAWDEDLEQRRIQTERDRLANETKKAGGTR